MLKRLVAAIVLIAVVAAGVYLYKTRQSAARTAAMRGGPPPATVTATTVTRTPWARRIESVGDLSAVQDVALASEVPGKVVAIAFESGAAVEAGDVLVRLDDADDRAQLASLQADLELAELEDARLSGLRGSAAFSQSQLDRARAQVASLKAQVDRQRVLIGRKLVRAPFDGVLGIRRVNLGDIVAPGTPLVRLQSLDPIYVDFTVPERVRGRVDPGQRLELSVAAWPEETFSGELTVVSPDVDVRSRTLMLRGELANDDRRLQPGMFATVHLILSGDEPVLTLPRTAVSFFAYGESVFVIEETADGLIVHRRPVTVGRTRGERVEIVEGLAAGQRVVHTGHLKLREGARVEIVEGPALPEGVVDR
ncbi:MAG: efflux RND transporter periplasmic adaptor subunit [Pseudomonadales bacterium]|jgi:membrane fusion protein (multidrug efflux system)|nr:efflux RND transporter periplasmic adaptor subunit [Pseudomonadales bacterium]